MKLPIILFLLLSSLIAFPQDLTPAIDGYINSYVATADFSGCVLINKGDSTLYENCFGQANYNFSIPNQSYTRFKIGSISKQFTAAAILILEEQGLLKTKDPLSTYFPNSPNSKEISLEQLLTHTSGVADIYRLPGFNKLSCEELTIRDLSERILDLELDFQPGERYQYSNGAYALLAAIIEQASGMSYQAFLRQHLFKPLGMYSSGHARGKEVVAMLSTGYDPLGYDGLKETDFIDPELLKGSGSLYSTIHDLKLWISSLQKRSLLSAASYEKFFNNYGHNYGLGISVYSSYGQQVFGHDGRINGFIADYLYYEKDEVSIILLGNTQTGVADFLRRDIAAILFGKEYQSKAKVVPPSLQAPKDIEQLIGTYSFGPGFNVYISENRGRIMARANEGGSSELVLLEDGRYFSRMLYSYIRFVERKDGSISHMEWINNDGNRFEGKKQ